MLIIAIKAAPKAALMQVKPLVIAKGWEFWRLPCRPG
jgi:hypothetical protein